MRDRGPSVELLLRDIRHGLRRLGRDFRFTLPAVLILALGIGANTATFSVVNAALLREPSVREPDRVVDLYQIGVNPGGVDASSYPAYLDMAAQRRVFESTTAVLVPLGVKYRHEGALRPAVVEHTTATYPAVLGLRPSLGRWFSAAEDAPGAQVVAVIGHLTWKRAFHGDPSVIGRTIPIEGVPATIVGVGPSGHRATLDLGVVTDFWLPISSLPKLGAPPRALERRPDEAGFLVKARLRDGVSVAQAQAAMRILGTRLAAEYPTQDPGKGIAVFAASDVRVHPQLDGLLDGIAVVLLGVVGLVLAVACSNLATLLLVRGAARAREVSIRLALGATRRQLVRQLLVESLLLSLGGGLAGSILAFGSIRLLGTLELPIGVDLSLDHRVLLFAFGLSVLAGVAFGLVPALNATRIELVPALREGSGARPAAGRWLTLRNAFVVVQVAVSVVLLGGTSIFLQMIDATGAREAGFAIDGVAMLETDTRHGGYSATEVHTRLEEIRGRIAATPGVASAVLTRGRPMQVTGVPLFIEGAADRTPASAGAIWAGPGFFDALRIPILHGRAIDERDRLDTPRVAVVSEAMARHYFGGRAVGRRLRFDEDSSGWLEVVGVARDTGTSSPPGDLVDPTPHLVYRSFAQSDLEPDTILARASFDAASLAGVMQRELRTTDATLQVASVQTMARVLEESLVAYKAAASLLAVLAAVGLCLAGIGLYAVVAFRASTRSREIGIRLALGARSSQVVWAVTREVAALVAVGTGMGLSASLMALLALRAFSAPAVGFSQYRPEAEPLVFASIAAFMAVVGAAATAIPAWRATRLDPLVTLRRD